LLPLFTSSFDIPFVFRFFFGFPLMLLWLLFIYRDFIATILCHNNSPTHSLLLNAPEFLLDKKGACISFIPWSLVISPRWSAIIIDLSCDQADGKQLVSVWKFISRLSFLTGYLAFFFYILNLDLACGFVSS